MDVARTATPTRGWASGEPHPHGHVQQGRWCSPSRSLARDRRRSPARSPARRPTRRRRWPLPDNLCLRAPPGTQLAQSRAVLFLSSSGMTWMTKRVGRAAAEAFCLILEQAAAAISWQLIVHCVGSSEHRNRIEQ